MKKLILFLSLTLSLSPLSAETPLDETELPQEFYVQERFISLMRTFDVHSKDQLFGTATKTFFAMTPTYTLRDPWGQTLAEARERFFSLLKQVDVVDAQGQSLGKLEAEFNLLWRTFRLLDRNQKIIARGQLNFWETCYTFFDPLDESRVIATVSRPFFNFFGHSWTVKIEEEYRELLCAENPWLFTLIAIYQTDSERTNQQMQRRGIHKGETLQKITEGNLEILHNLVCQLNQYGDLYQDLEPSFEDVTYVEKLTSDQLSTLFSDLSFEELSGEELSQKRLELGLTQFLPLLDEESDLLSNGQKCALYHMLNTLVIQVFGAVDKVPSC